MWLYKKIIFHLWDKHCLLQQLELIAIACSTLVYPCYPCTCHNVVLQCGKCSCSCCCCCWHTKTHRRQFYKRNIIIHAAHNDGELRLEGEGGGRTARGTQQATATKRPRRGWWREWWWRLWDLSPKGNKAATKVQPHWVHFSRYSYWGRENAW